MESRSGMDHREEELSLRAGALIGSQAAVSEIDARCRRMQEEQTNVEAKQTARRKDLEEMERQLADVSLSMCMESLLAHKF